MKDIEYYFKPRDASYDSKRKEGLDVHKQYKTRSGQNVRIYSKEGNELHGAIQTGKKWQIDTWNLDGSYLEGGKEHQRDILLTPQVILKPNTMYRTRDGRQAMVSFINQGCVSDPVVGFILEKDGFWYARSWNLNGHVKRPYWPKNDLTAEWSNS